MFFDTPRATMWAPNTFAYKSPIPKHAFTLSGTGPTDTPAYDDDGDEVRSVHASSTPA